MKAKPSCIKLAPLIIVSVLFLVACQLDRTDRQTASINLDTLTDVSVFDIFETIKVLQLETHSEALIGDIGKVMLSNSQYYISDLKTQQIYRFNSDGKFLSKVNSKGNGPGEYNWIGDFTVDSLNNQILLLDPAVQKVFCYDIEGNHLETLSIKTDKVMGYNSIYVLNDTVLLISSITNDQLIFYNRVKREIIHTDFSIPFPLGTSPLKPTGRVYQSQGRTFALRGLSLDVFDVTNIQPLPYFSWCFGRYNNSNNQLQKTLDELEVKIHMGGHKFTHDLVGKGKILHHHIMRVSETPRFKIARLEFNNDYLNIIIDKKSNKQYTFNTFKEGISLNSAFLLQENEAIAYKRDLETFLVKNNYKEMLGRNYTSFCKSTLTEEDRKIVDNHDEIAQNPFLVIYKFKN